jgi:hypothetical protein
MEHCQCSGKLKCSQLLTKDTIKSPEAYNGYKAHTKDGITTYTTATITEVAFSLKDMSRIVKQPVLPDYCSQKTYALRLVLPRKKPRSPTPYILCFQSTRYNGLTGRLGDVTDPLNCCWFALASQGHPIVFVHCWDIRVSEDGIR